MSAVKNQPATPLNPVQTFYGTPTPENAVLLAMADHRAHCDPMQPQSEFITALQKAHDRLVAYPKLVEALRDAMHYSDYCANNGGQQADKDHAKFVALLRELGETS